MYDIVEDCDAHIKKKEFEGESSISQQKKKVKETNFEDRPRRKQISWKKIKIDDIASTGKGVKPFNLEQELISSGQHITWSQLLQISPSLKKEWGRVSSMQQIIKTLHDAKIV